MTDWLEKLSNKQILSVSELNFSTKVMLEREFNTVWVEGEISNFSRPASGHWYFTLKDDRAQIRCAMFKGKNSRLKFTPKNGDAAVLRGSVSLYAPRGDYQLIADSLTEAGAGALQRQFEQLKAELEAQGWFAAQNKKALPERPQKIAVITSETGAVWHDIQTCFKRRNPFAELILLPVAVQGDQAIAAICNALKQSDKLAIDAVILARGGGSLEDLAAFNSREVATAVYQSQHPIVAGVGHETDFSIAEFVADMRAATPTAAAELLSPDLKHDIRLIEQMLNRSRLQIASQLRQRQLQLSAIFKRLKHPQTTIDEQRIVTDKLVNRLQQAIDNRLNQSQRRVEYANSRLTQASPEKTLALYKLRLSNAKDKLQPLMDNHYKAHAHRLSLAMTTLHTVSPLATLDRGYAIVKSGSNVVTSAGDLKHEQKITLNFHDGRAAATVDQSEK